MDTYKAVSEASLATRSTHTHPAREAMVASARPTKRLQVVLPAPLHKALKARAVQQECGMTDIVITLITQYLHTHTQG